MIRVFLWARTHPDEAVLWAIVGVLGGYAAWVGGTTAAATAGLYSPLPFSDQWVTVTELKILDEGESSLWSELWRQHNEHRLVLPRLILYADFWLFGGTNVFPITMIWLAQVAHIAALGAAGWMVVARNDPSGRWRAGLLAAQVAVFFSAAQLENFSWGFQIQIVAVFLAASLAFLAMAGGCRYRRRNAMLGAALFVAALAAATASVLSSANGALVWPILVLIAVWHRAPRPWVGVLAACGTTQIALYLWGYDRPHDHTSPFEALGDPLAVADYFAAYMGNEAGTLGIVWARVFGMGALLAYALVGAALVLLRWRSVSAVTLFAVMSFVVGSAFITSLGRINFGSEQALAGRYTTGPLLFWVAAGPLLLQAWTEAGRQKLPRWSLAGAVALLLAVPATAFDAQRDVPPALEVRQRTWSRVEDAFIAGVYDEELIVPMFAPTQPDADAAKALIEWLRANHYSVFSGRQSRWIGEEFLSQFEVVGVNTCLGSFDEARAVPGSDGARVIGWSWDPPEFQTFSQVVVVDADGQIVGIAHGGTLERPDVPEAVPAIKSNKVGWDGYAGRGVSPLRAYGVLGPGRVCQLANEQRLPE